MDNQSPFIIISLTFVFIFLVMLGFWQEILLELAIKDQELRVLRKQVEQQQKQLRAVPDEEHQMAAVVFGKEAEELCGPQPPAICRPGMALGCRLADKQWDCYPIESGIETSTWQTYRNEKYGFEVKYPKDWIFDVKSTGVAGFLDIHLNNFGVGDYSPSCPSMFQGLEIQVNYSKNSIGDFDTFVRSQVIEEGKGLNPGGRLEAIQIDGHRALRVEHSGWDSACEGPGYFINAPHYTYVFTGKSQGASSRTIDQILSTFKFIPSINSGPAK